MIYIALVEDLATHRTVFRRDCASAPEGWECLLNKRESDERANCEHDIFSDTVGELGYLAYYADLSNPADPMRYDPDTGWGGHEDGTGAIYGGTPALMTPGGNFPEHDTGFAYRVMLG